MGFSNPSESQAVALMWEWNEAKAAGDLNSFYTEDLGLVLCVMQAFI